MKVTTREIGFESLDTLADVEALCLFVAQDERPLRGVSGYVDWRLCGALSRVLTREFFTGAGGDCLLLPANGRIAPPRIFACGAGAVAGLDAPGLTRILAEAAGRLDRAKIRTVALEVPAAGALSDEARVRAVREGFLARFGGDQVVVLAEKPVARLLAQG